MRTAFSNLLRGLAAALIGAAVAGPLVMQGPSVAAQAPVTPGFTDTIVLSGLQSPTAVRFSPDGRIFVAEKSGLIKVFQDLSDTSPTVFADLRTNVHNFWDRGLLSLALDPGFPARPYVYVLYTFDGPVGGPAPKWGAPGETSDPCPDPPGATALGCEVSGRLSRLQASGNVMTGAEQVLIHDWFQQFSGHSIGDLVFGPDGALYASGGEGASFQFVDYGQIGNPGGDPPVGVGGVQTPPTAEGGSLRSQDVRTSADRTGLSGSVIRVNPSTGAALPDNPKYSSADANTRRIVAYGFRTPFRLTVRPGTNEIWVADVGWRKSEEINRITNPLSATVRNFGWPCYEGAARQSGFDSANLALCETLYAAAAVTSPFFEYVKGSAVVAGETCPSMGASITGLAFYRGGTYPSRYNGSLFFADYTRRCIWVMFRGADGLPDPATRAPFITSARYPVDLQVGPGGDLFYVDHYGGKIRRIRYSASNTPPTARVTATPTFGQAPLAVQFDGRGSSDPEDASLEYDWDLNGDGAFGDATTAAPSFTYSSNGVRTVSLRVTDTGGLSDTATVAISVGNSPPTAAIDTPAATLRWRVGQVVSFSGRGTDPEQGTLPQASLRWSLIMNHCATPSSCHQHMIQQFAGVASGTFSAPDHEYPSYLSLELTARDAGGLEHTVTRRLDPQTVALTFQTSPSGLQVTVGGDTFDSPGVRTVIVGSSVSIGVPSPQTLSGASYTFNSWSDAGAQTHNIVAGTAAATYTAAFRASTTTLPAPWTNRDVGTTGGSAGYAGGRFSIRAYGSDIWSTSDGFHFVSRPWTGDGELIARVAALPLPAGASFASAGIMFRESMAANARHASVFIGTSGKLKFRRRTTVGGTTASDGPSAGSIGVPYWIRLARAGNVFTAYHSNDGRTWTQTAPSLTLTLPATLNVGLFALRDAGMNPAVPALDNVWLRPGRVPSPWTSADVGMPGGSAGYASGAFSLRAYGTDIWSTSDAFHFVSRSWTGDGEIAARVASLPLPPGATFAMGGLMFRESTAANARHASVLVGTDGKLKFRRRTTVGGTTLSDGPSAGSVGVPYWIKLARAGNVFTAYRSTDGRAWTQTGPATTINVGATLHVGLFALRSGGSNPAIVTFDNVSSSVDGWKSDDVGAVGAAGSLSRVNGVTTMRGGGSDIWSTADAFHFGHRTWTGDGDLVVRIDSLAKPAAAAWAMAGIMFRESLGAGSRHVALLLSTEGKLKFRRRSTTNGSTASDGPSTGSRSAPRWLKLTRRGNVFSAFESADGSRWTAVHTPQTIALAPSLEVGVWTLRSGPSGLSSATISGLSIVPQGQ